MGKARLTIGMATYRDFDGVYFSINALRLYHSEVIDRCELIVVDNDPKGPQHDRLKNFMGSVRHGSQASRSFRDYPGLHNAQPFNVHYIELGETQGTSAPRDLIFQKAAGDAVLVLDSHVDVWPGAIARLLRYFDDHPASSDLLQGPLVMDDLRGVCTHFDDVWRGGMWGVWGNAWQTPEGKNVSTRPNSRGQTAIFDLLTGVQVEELPVTWPGHESRLLEMGYSPLANQLDPFEIPAQGLGLFACRKEAWLGFNPLFREFGGEECYIHTKFRQAGHKCLCLPWLKWVHRFADPAGGRNYTRSNLGKVRNYILGMNENRLPLDRLRRHFVEGLSEDPAQPNSHGGVIDAATWDSLVADPERYPIDVGRKDPVAIAQNDAEKQSPVSIEELFQIAATTPSDLNEHCPKLRELASQCDLVVDFGHRPEVSTVALLAGQPRRMLTYGEAPHNNIVQLYGARGRTRLEFRPGNTLTVEIPKCDLLFIDTKHTGAHLWAEFERHAHQATRFIVLHDTQIYGHRGEDGSPGLLTAVKRLVTERDEWAIVSHSLQNFGLTVLSCREEDRPQRPIRLWPLGYGPGTELRRMLAMLGVNPAPGCDCVSKANKMDDWGVTGCRERREEILTWLREGQVRWGWKEKLSAVGKAVTSGLAFQLNPLDPYPSLVDAAISQAERSAEQHVTAQGS